MEQGCVSRIWCEPELRNKERERGGERIVQNNFPNFFFSSQVESSQRIISYFSPLEDVTICPQSLMILEQLARSASPLDLTAASELEFMDYLSILP